jgi:hypothetical protein
MSEVKIPEHVDRFRETQQKINVFIRKNAAYLLTGAYVLLCIVGMGYNWRLLHEFGVNVLDYSQIADFFIGGIRRPVPITGIVLFMLFTYSMPNVEVWGRTRFPWLARFAAATDKYEKALWDPRMSAIGLLVASVFYVYQPAGMEAHRIKAHGRGERVLIERSSSLAGGGSDLTALQRDERRPRILILTTTSYVLSYDPDSARVEISPIENITRIISLGPDRERHR